MINKDKFRNSTAAIIFLLLAPQFAQASGFGCMLKPIKTVDIRSPVVGRLSSVQVERGNYVKKGQVLARLDNSVEQASTNSAKY
ncbi:biotin/lipoyl-binding protein [Psychrobacter alimentarius]|uniref:biotin/lipoyl-binding protein n=1 Tax=Psychrobacter alimentarius TaxID=261164 RepID=UPI00191A1D1C|nr:biotin/lipoyl-binding protein [Psychrobacter alimentarius]